MLDIVSGNNHPEWKHSLLEDYSRKIMENDFRFNSSQSKSLIAIKDNEPMGLMLYEDNPDFKIHLIHIVDDDLDILDAMMRTALSMAANAGKDSVTVHALDINGTMNSPCLRMGFKFSNDCPCCQRQESVCLRYSF